MNERKAFDSLHSYGNGLPENWEVKMPHLDMKAAKFDISLIFQEEKDGIRAQFQYSNELFKHATIERYFMLINYVI